MNGFAKWLAVVVAGCSIASAANNAVAKAVEAAKDVPLKADPNSSFWREAPPVRMQKDIQGKAASKYRGEARIRWTKDNLYFLFTCPYEELYLKPDPKTDQETNELWNWDVAEVFVGSDFQDIKRYKEFEVSPQGEWVDLDIDLNKPHHENGWTWNSGFEVAVQTNASAHVWYAAMRIPYSAVDTHPAAIGNKLRMNLFRSQGPPAHHYEITWQAPHAKTFHVPERFGILTLVGRKP